MQQFLKCINFSQHCTFVTFPPWAGNKIDALMCEIVPIAENLLDLEGKAGRMISFSPGMGLQAFHC